jgi:hypothetical protein
MSEEDHVVPGRRRRRPRGGRVVGLGAGLAGEGQFLLELV